MKKSLLALAIASIAASSVASAATVYDKDGTKVDVYGRMQSVWYSVNSGDGLSGAYNDNSIDTTARLGLNVRQEVMPGLAAYGNIEWEAASTSEDFAARYAFAGLDFGQYGKVQAGHFDRAIKYVISQTDIFDDWGCNGQLGNDDRNSSLIGYYWSGFGFDVNAVVGMAANAQHIDGAYKYNETLDVDDSYGLSVGYTSVPVVFGPISVRAGYEHVQFQQKSDGSTQDLSNYDQYAVSASWGNLSSGFYVAALYQSRDFEAMLRSQDYTVDGAEFVLGYSFANGVTTRIGYNYMNYDPEGKESSSASTLPVYVNYQLSPAFNVWAEARFDVGTDDDVSGANWKSDTLLGWDQNVFSVGARYTF